GCRVVGRGENGSQPGSGGDPGLRKHPVQVIADGSVGQIESGTDDLVRKSLGGELCDVQLLRGQVLPDLLGAAKACFTGCPQLLARAIAPGRSAERVENVAG